MNEIHPLKPYIPKHARLLMLGSFPPPRARWCMDFYYPNFINDMWRIFGIIFKGDKLAFVDEEHKTFRLTEIKALLSDKGIAIYDTASEVKRLNNNASDKFLEIVKPTDIYALLSKIPECKAIAATGGKSAEELATQLKTPIPQTGKFASVQTADRKLMFFRMPSSSRAYPLSIEKKAEYYKAMFATLGMLP